MASKKTCDKKQRTPRTVANAKPLNRRGGGKAPERRITSAAKVLGVQSAVFNEAKKFATLNGALLLGDVEAHLMFLCSLIDESYLWDWYTDLDRRIDNGEESTFMDAINVKQMEAAQKAFYFACKVVPDSAFAYSYGDCLAVRGREHSFFTALVKKDEKEEAERRERNRQRNRANGRTFAGAR